MLTWTDEDMETQEFETPEVGQYLAEVKEVREKKTRNQDNMWSICFKEVGTSRVLCWDNLVFSKGGKPIAFKKLSILGVPKIHGQYEIGHRDELVGKRVFVSLIHEPQQDSDGNVKKNANGETVMRAVVDFNSEGFGYEPADGQANPDDIPF